MDEHLGVAARREAMAGALELGGQLPVVVDLAVADDDDGAVFVGDGLVSARDVDDGEPSYPEEDVVVHVGSFVIRPPVDGHGAHPLERAGLWPRIRREGEDPVNAAHDQLTSAGRRPG